MDYSRERHDFFRHIDTRIMDSNTVFPECAGLSPSARRHWDNSILTDYPRDLFKLHSRLVMKSLSNIKTGEEFTGLKIHQLYNMGTVIEYPGFAVGIDIIPGMNRFDCKWFIPQGFYSQLAEKLDVLCISHMYDNNPAHPGLTWTHVDHCDIELMGQVIINNKINGSFTGSLCRIIVPKDVRDNIAQDIHRYIHNRRPEHGDSCYSDISMKEIIDSLIPSGHKQTKAFQNCVPTGKVDYKISSFKARHVYQSSTEFTPQNIYEISGPDKRILFLADHDYTGSHSIPDTREIDLLIAHYGGVSPLYDDMIPGNPGDLEALVKGIRCFNPKRVLLSHVGELGHAPGGGRESWARAYEDSVKASRITGRKVDLLFWGETMII